MAVYNIKKIALVLTTILASSCMASEDPFVTETFDAVVAKFTESSQQNGMAKHMSLLAGLRDVSAAASDFCGSLASFMPHLRQLKALEQRYGSCCYVTLPPAEDSDSSKLRGNFVWNNNKTVYVPATTDGDKANQELAKISVKNPEPFKLKAAEYAESSDTDLQKIGTIGLQVYEIANLLKRKASTDKAFDRLTGTTQSNPETTSLISTTQANPIETMAAWNIYNGLRNLVAMREGDPDTFFTGIDTQHLVNIFSGQNDNLRAKSRVFDNLKSHAAQEIEYAIAQQESQ